MQPDTGPRGVFKGRARGGEPVEGEGCVQKHKGVRVLPLGGELRCAQGPGEILWGVRKHECDVFVFRHEGGRRPGSFNAAGYLRFLALNEYPFSVRPPRAAPPWGIELSLKRVV